MKDSRMIVAAALFTAALAPGTVRAEVLLREEFDGYAPGSIHGQAGLGTGLTGNWNYFRGSGTMTIGPGLSGANALVVDAEGGDNDLSIGHTVAGWGTGQMWMSYLYNEVSYGGHAYVTGGNDLSGAFGHAWSSNFGINNESGPGNVPYTQGITYRIVALIDWDAGTTTIWVDPDPNTVPVTDPLDASFAPAAHKAEAQGTATTLRLGYYNTDCTVDDIIIGTTYADVAIAVSGDPPVAPNPISPTDAAIGVLLDTSLEWTPNGATSYGVFLWKDGDSKPGTPTDTVTNPVYQPAASLDPVTLYHWQVDSTNDNGTTTGATWTFTTNDGVVAVSPPDAVSDVPVNIPFGWTDNGATSWDVYLWKDGDPKPGTPTATVTDPSYTPASLDADTLYHWEIVSNYAVGSPTTSATWSFTTSDGVPGQLLLHEEFDGYASGSIIGQTGQGLGESGAWEFQDSAGTFELGPGLSGDNGLVVTATEGADAKIAHTVPGWGTGVLYMSYLWNETSYVGHAYVSGGGSFPGAFGHPWSTSWAINNDGNGVSYNFDQTYRLVARIDWDAGVTTMWVDPVYEFDTPVAVKSEVQSATPTLILRYWGTDGTIDDIRIGTDFASVIEDIVVPDELQLQVAGDGANLDISWNSKAGRVYDLLSSTDPSLDPATWPVVAGQEGIVATPDTNTLTIPRPADDTRFYVVQERPAPPFFFEDFESDSGWSSGANSGDAGNTVWERGAPVAILGGGATGPATGANGSTNCYGTNIAAIYGSDTDIYLRSPEINLTSLSGGDTATLTLQYFIDTDLAAINPDRGSIRVLNANNLSEQLGADLTGNDGLGNIGSDWLPFSETLPAEALGKTVVLEFQFTSNDDTENFGGFYIDEVAIEVN